MGNKKSVLCFAISAYQLKMHNQARQIFEGKIGIGKAIANVIDKAETKPSRLAPAAIGYWFWGKPFKGKL